MGELQGQLAGSDAADQPAEVRRRDGQMACARVLTVPYPNGAVELGDLYALPTLSCTSARRREEGSYGRCSRKGHFPVAQRP